MPDEQPNLTKPPVQRIFKEEDFITLLKVFNPIFTLFIPAIFFKLLYDMGHDFPKFLHSTGFQITLLVVGCLYAITTLVVVVNNWLRARNKLGELSQYLVLLYLALLVSVPFSSIKYILCLTDTDMRYGNLAGMGVF